MILFSVVVIILLSFIVADIADRQTDRQTSSHYIATK